MSGIGIDGNISSLLSFYRHERNIFGRCPNCCEPFRLSEVKLSYGKEPPRDFIRRLKLEREKLQERIASLEEEIESAEVDHSNDIDNLKAQHSLKVDATNEKWEDKVDVAVQRQLSKRVKEIRQEAIAKSRAGQLGKTLEKIAPMFPGFGHHPSDVRPIFDPIDFVIFDGHYQGEVSEVVFVEFKTSQSSLSPVQRSIRRAIDKKAPSRFLWKYEKRNLWLSSSKQPAS